MGFVDKMKALFMGIYGNANLIKWECFALTVVVFFQSVQGPTNPQYALTGAVLTASMWLISGGSADVHFCVTLYKVFVSYETKLHAGLARLIGQAGGGFCGALIVMVLDRHDDVSNYPVTTVANGSNFRFFLYEAIATSIVLLVFNKVAASESNEITAFGFAAILYVLSDYVTNPARVFGPHLLQKNGEVTKADGTKAVIDDFGDRFDIMWPTWFGPMAGAAAYGVLKILLDNEWPPLFVWIASKMPCCKPKTAAESERSAVEKPAATPEVVYPEDP